MDRYKNYSASEFANDDDFVLWVRNPDKHPDLVDFWEAWMSQNPDKTQEIQEARELVSLFADSKQYANRKESVWNRIEGSIDELNEEEEQNVSGSRVVSLSTMLKVAAIVTFFVIAGTYWFQQKDVNSPTASTSIIANKIIQNVDPTPKTVLLADGSSVILYQNTKLEILEGFDEDEREVRIDGKAFFEVIRNESKPFLVQAKNIQTKVLGTSFLVTAYDQQDITITVNTGIVAVSQKDAQAEDTSEITLERNEAAAYARNTSTLEKLDVSQIELDKRYYSEDFDFESTPLLEVFELIEERYGVHISYDSNALNDCRLNASLAGIPLEDKIRLICQTSNLTYTVKDSNIDIEGTGCSSM